MAKFMFDCELYLKRTVDKSSQTSTSTSTLFNKNIDYNRLACKIAIANLGGPVKRKINWKEGNYFRLQ